ncbi:MAG TPA: hypothetical protein VIT45_09450 [Allosphingosinicella sp.]
MSKTPRLADRLVADAALAERLCRTHPAAALAFPAAGLVALAPRARDVHGLRRTTKKFGWFIPTAIFMCML